MGKRPHRVTEKSKKNLTGAGRFANNTDLAKECQKLSVAKRLENQKKEKEIERTVDILTRVLNKKIKNNNTGEEITQKEVMIITLLNKAIADKDLKAIEIILKLLGDFEDNQTNIIVNQPIQISKTELDSTVQNIMNLADEG